MKRHSLLFFLLLILFGASNFISPSGRLNSIKESSRRYKWNSASADILINNKVFGPLRGGDSIIIPSRRGGYNSFTIDRLNCGTSPNELQEGRGFITILFEPAAYMAPSNSDNLGSYLDSSYGVKIYGYKSFQRVGVPWRLGTNNYGPFAGKPHGYSSYIWVDSFKLVGSTGFENYYTGPYPEFSGNPLNSMHHWKFTNGIIDSSCAAENMGSGQVGIILGQLNKDGFWLDIEIANVHFDHYYSAKAFSSGYIMANNSYNVKIHDCTFKNLGMVKNPAGHTAVIYYDVGKVDVYNNRFGPNNFGNDVRCKTADLPIKDYMGLSRVYNNISFNKRKYPFVEAQNVADQGKNIRSYYRPRTGPQIYNNTCYNMAVGMGNDPYIAALYDCYRNDTIICYNNLFVKLRDVEWTTEKKAMIGNNGGPVSKILSGSNIFVATWAESGLADSVYFRPKANGPLHNTGKPVPSWANKDIYGTPRPTGPGVDIGAVELASTKK